LFAGTHSTDKVELRWKREWGHIVSGIMALVINVKVPIIEWIHLIILNKGNNKSTELRTILQRESQNS
jgi:hypothetical protein